MTIIVFYPASNPFEWGRDALQYLDDDLAFKKFWEEREDLGAAFYNMSTRSYSDRFGQLGFLNAADFESYFNDEVIDSSRCWCRVFTLGEDWVWEAVNNGR